MSELEADVLARQFRDLLEQMKTAQMCDNTEKGVSMLLRVAAEVTESCAFDLARSDTRRQVTELILISSRLDKMSETIATQ